MYLACFPGDFFHGFNRGRSDRSTCEKVPLEILGELENMAICGKFDDSKSESAAKRTLD